VSHGEVPVPKDRPRDIGLTLAGGGSRSFGARASRLYLAPSAPLPVTCWDYTSSERVEATLAMGHAEAELHAPLLERFLAAPQASDQLTVFSASTSCCKL